MIKIHQALFVLFLFGSGDSLFCADSERIVAEAGKPFGERRGARQEAGPVVVDDGARGLSGCCAQKDELEMLRTGVDYRKNAEIPYHRNEAKGHRKSAAIFGVAGLSALSLLVAGAIAYHHILQYAGYAGVAVAGLSAILIFANLKEAGLWEPLGALALLLAIPLGLLFPVALGSLALGIGAVVGLRVLQSEHGEAVKEDKKADDSQREMQEAQQKIICVENNCVGAKK